MWVGFDGPAKRCAFKGVLRTFRINKSPYVVLMYVCLGKAKDVAQACKVRPEGTSAGEVRPQVTVSSVHMA